MIVELRCKSCNSVVEYNTAKKTDTYQKCNNCGAVIPMSIEEKIERLLNLDGFEFVNIKKLCWEQFYYEDSNIALLNHMASEIKALYKTAPADYKKSIVKIMECIWLLLRTKDQDMCIDLLALLSEQYGKEIAEGREDTGNLLGL